MGDTMKAGTKKLMRGLKSRRPVAMVLRADFANQLKADRKRFGSKSTRRLVKGETPMFR
jgi:hypothetical protein